MKSEFCWNFCNPPNLSSSCDNNYSYVKHVSFKSIIFGRYKMIKKTAENSRKVALRCASTLQKNFLWRWPPVALRGFCVYSWSAHCLQEFCQKGCRCSMANFIGIGTGALVEKDGQVEGLGGLVHVEQKRRRATPI